MPTLHWIGKEKIINHHLEVPYRTLLHSHSYGLDKSGNRIIHGDNLEALKSLMPEYEGCIKCIYIDPPYNTGNEGWRYNDNVSDPRLLRWLHHSVGKEGDDLSRHDKWLCMMYPRLRLLYKLLADNGVLIISIDDNEVATLKMLLNEVFGQQGMVGTFVWRRRVTSSMSASWISTDHEYIIVFSKNPEKVNVYGEDRDMDKYNIPDGTGRFYASMPLTVGMNKEMRPNQWYELIDPKSGSIYWPTPGRVWAYYPPTMNQKIKENKIIWPDDFPDKKLTTPRLKSYPEDAKRDRKPLSTWIFETNVEKDNFERTYLSSSKNEEGAKVVKQIFGDTIFNYAKPISLIQSLIRQFTNDGDVILDSFAGSGTTAHAVLNLNHIEKSDRKFILIEMEGYAQTLTAERVRRVIDGYADKAGTGGGFDFYELGEALFDINGYLSPSANIEDIRRYIWHVETRLPFSASNETRNPWFLGTHDGTDWWFCYESGHSTSLDLSLLFVLKKEKIGSAIVVYADYCALPEDLLKKENIRFKKIPRDIPHQ